jgi:hypothetical protein
MIIGFVGLWFLAAMQIAIAARWFSHARDALDVTASLVIFVFAAIVLSSSHFTARGQFGRTSDTPAALLGALERRHIARLRMMRWIPWLTGAVVTATIALTIATMLAVRRFDAFTVVSVALCCAASIGYSRFVMKRVGAKIGAELRDIARARELVG